MGAPTLASQPINPGGNQRALNVTAIGAIKQGSQGAAVSGTLMRIIPQAPGSAGSLVLSDINPLAYNANTAYVAGQPVLYSSTLYFCILASTGNLPTNGTYFNTTPPASSIIVSLLYSAMTASVPIVLEFPFTNGLWVSAVPSAGSPGVNISYF